MEGSAVSVTKNAQQRDETQPSTHSGKGQAVAAHLLRTRSGLSRDVELLLLQSRWRSGDESRFYSRVMLTRRLLPARLDCVHCVARTRKLVTDAPEMLAPTDRQWL